MSRTADDRDVRAHAPDGPTLCFVCSPSLGILDNWLPVLWNLRKASSRITLVCVLPRPRSVDELDLSNVLVVLAGTVFDRVMFRSHAGNWLSTPTFPEAVALHRLGRGEAVWHNVANRLQAGRLTAPASRALRRGLELLERCGRARADAVVRPEAVLEPVRAVLYDITEELKDYNADVMRCLDGVPRFSLLHGIELKSPTAGPQQSYELTSIRASATAYLFSDLERDLYRHGRDMTLRVVGIPRHEPQWMQTIIEHGSAAAAELGEGFVFVISKPVNKRYLFRERKRQALEHVRRLASELGRKVVIKRHPKEHADGLCEDVFGREAYGERWAYSNLHPFVLGTRCAFAISLRSSVVLDMIAVGTPVIELVDLRGIPRYDHADAPRDEQGEPVLGYRYWGLVLGASEYGRLKRHAEEILEARDRVVRPLVSRYRELFPLAPDAAASMAQDVLNTAAQPAARAS
jgi:hypothetical protein